MKNKLLSKNKLFFIPFISLIGIILYVLLVFSFDPIEEINYDKKYYFILPIYFIGILSSGLYSIIYFHSTFKYNLSFGITRKKSFKNYLKIIFSLLILLIIFAFVYFVTILIYLLIKNISFNNVIKFIIKLINDELLIDLIFYYIFINGLLGLISNIFDNINRYIIICFVISMLVLFILNIIFPILNINIILNIIFGVIGLIGLFINYKYVMKKKN